MRRICFDSGAVGRAVHPLIFNDFALTSILSRWERRRFSGTRVSLGSTSCGWSAGVRAALAKYKCEKARAIRCPLPQGEEIMPVRLGPKRQVRALCE
jgi:hypothetical protein